MNFSYRESSLRGSVDLYNLGVNEIYCTKHISEITWLDEVLVDVNRDKIWKCWRATESTQENLFLSTEQQDLSGAIMQDDDFDDVTKLVCVKVFQELCIEVLEKHKIEAAED